MNTFLIEIDTKLDRKQRGRLQRAAFRWRVQIGAKRDESGPWKQDWGLLYECPAASEAEARARVTEVVGVDLGDQLICTPN